MILNEKMNVTKQMEHTPKKGGVPDGTIESCRGSKTFKPVEGQNLRAREHENVSDRQDRASNQNPEGSAGNLDRKAEPTRCVGMIPPFPTGGIDIGKPEAV